MTETTDRAVPRQAPAPMPVGGQVTAIVPQSFEEIQRISNTVITGGLAPASLIKWPKDNDTDEVKHDLGRCNIAAVAGVLMAGAELGVPPMAALRMFTSINGRPALYADGNVAVVRRARDRDGILICEYIRQGYERGDTDADTYAWCEAKRADNGEVHREEFSVEDAKRAGLWENDAIVEREVWEYVEAERKRKPIKRKVPNDAPWYRYPKRMMMWRATGYCLRWLFADVLAGMVDEFEAREIAGMVDITPQLPPSTRPTPPTPPAEEDENQDASNEAETATTTTSDATEQPEIATEGMTLAEADVARQAELHNSDQPAGVQNEVAALDWRPAYGGEAPVPMPPPPPPEEEEERRPDVSDTARFLNHIDETLATAADDAQLIILWEELEVQHEFADDEDALRRAFEIKKAHEDRIKRLMLTLAGQGDLLGGGNG